MNAVRYNIDGVTVRFFGDIKSAQSDATTRVKLIRGVFLPVKAGNGYFLVLNKVNQDLFDVDGRVPEPAKSAIISAGLLEVLP